MRKETLIAKIAKETLQIEIDTLKGLDISIDNAFISAVSWIASQKGRLIVTGIGKSAIVGQKMVATFNSTGTPSVFMHASDAIHGDLGIIQKKDTILVISKSGSTPEIKVLMESLQKLKNPTIAMVSNLKSALAKVATYTIHIPVPKEADPNNLAPTASTTAQMVIGDAMATSLLALRGFSSADFAQIHPGGSLGKQLFLRVQDLIKESELPQVNKNDSIHQVILEITSKRLGATAVTTPSGLLSGVITDGDLRRMLESGEDMSRLTAKDIMTANPKTIAIDSLATKAIEVIRQHGISQLVVLKGKKYAGILHIHDLIREGFF